MACFLKFHLDLQVTHDFCQWIADLGGETNNIEESTITSLFASGYDTKPALSVPIHVVELTNVPPELRMSVTTPSQQQAVKPTPKPEMSPHSWVCMSFLSLVSPAFICSQDRIHTILV